MNIKLKLSIVLLACAAIVYTACKKSGSNPSGPTISASTVSGQVALNLSQTLFGGYGGVNLSKGLDGPSDFGTAHTSGHLLHDLGNPVCGLVIDTTISYHTPAGSDSSASVSGHVKLSFTCANDVLTGYTTLDDLNVTITTPQVSATSKINENITLASLNPLDENAKFSLKGSLNTNSTYTYKGSPAKTGTVTFNYVLTSLILDPNEDGDVVSGSASFSTKGTGSNGVWDYTGTITFLGGHKATITINGKSYNVDLDTGASI